MLAYPIPEAEELLKSKLDTAKKSLANCEEDLEFLREQVTVCKPLELEMCVANGSRRWRLRSRVCTIGMLRSGGRRGRRASQ
jgi:hypothetical protein